MGIEPERPECDDVDPTKWYIAEVEAFWGGDPAIGCARPSIGYHHDVVGGFFLKQWICDNLNCADHTTLIAALGDAQFLLRFWGPYVDLAEAQSYNW